MRKIKIDPSTFDGGKFATRYGIQPKDILQIRGDDGNDYIQVPDSVPNTPTLDTVDPPDAPPTDQIRVMVQALWAKVMDGDNSKAVSLQGVLNNLKNKPVGKK